MDKVKHDNLVEALLCIQEEIANPKNTAVGYYQNGYCPLPELLDMVKPILNKHGVLMVQKLGSTEHGTACIQTTLSHCSGDKVESGWLPLNPKTDKDPQKLGSAITYLRRYQISAMLNIASQDDDDGNLASGKQVTKQSNKTVQKKTPTSSKKSPKSASANSKPSNKKKPKSSEPTPDELNSAVNSDEPNQLISLIKDVCPVLYNKVKDGVNKEVITKKFLVEESQNLLGENLISQDDLGLVKEALDV